MCVIINVDIVETRVKRSLLTRRDEITKRGKNISRFSFTFTTKRLHTKNSLLLPEMSNPVVFFDMEIGGQPAGRIEMTVRIVFLFSFFSRVFLSSRAPGAFLFSLDDDDETFLDHFFPINPAGKKSRRRRRFVFCSILARALTTSGGPLLLSSFVNDNENNTNNAHNKSSERTCARKPRKTSVSYAPGNPGLGSSNRRFTG